MKITSEQMRNRVQLLAVMIEAALPGWCFELRVRDALPPLTTEDVTVSTAEPKDQPEKLQNMLDEARRKASDGCCRTDGHDGPHQYKCAGEFCPGLGWRASAMAHPLACNLPGVRL